MSHLDTEEGDKIDFWLLTDDAFDQERSARCVSVPFAGGSIRVSTPEDTILMKLRWAADSGGSDSAKPTTPDACTRSRLTRSTTRTWSGGPQASV